MVILKILPVNVQFYLFMWGAQCQCSICSVGKSLYRPISADASLILAIHNHDPRARLSIGPYTQALVYMHTHESPVRAAIELFVGVSVAQALTCTGKLEEG